MLFACLFWTLELQPKIIRITVDKVFTAGPKLPSHVNVIPCKTVCDAQGIFAKCNSLIIPFNDCYEMLHQSYSNYAIMEFINLIPGLEAGSNAMLFFTRFFRD